MSLVNISSVELSSKKLGYKAYLLVKAKTDYLFEILFFNFFNIFARGDTAILFESFTKVINI